MELKIKKTVTVRAEEIRLYCKVTGRFTGHIFDQDGEEIGGQSEGYVPDFFPGPHYGDYLILNINLETGEISNWKTPSAEDVEKFLSEGFLSEGKQ